MDFLVFTRERDRTVGVSYVVLSLTPVLKIGVGTESLEIEREGEIMRVLSKSKIKPLLDFERILLLLEKRVKQVRSHSSDKNRVWPTLIFHYQKFFRLK